EPTQELVEVTLYLTLIDKLAGKDDGAALGHIAELLELEYQRGDWPLAQILEPILGRLTSEDRAFYQVLIRAIVNEAAVDELAAQPRWQQITASGGQP